MTVYVSVLRLTDTNMNHMTQFCLSLSCFRPLELSKCAFCNPYDSSIIRRNFNKLMIFVDFRFVIHLPSVNRQGISSTEPSSQQPPHAPIVLALLGFRSMSLDFSPITLCAAARAEVHNLCFSISVFSSRHSHFIQPASKSPSASSISISRLRHICCHFSSQTPLLNSTSQSCVGEGAKTRKTAAQEI